MIWYAVTVLKVKRKKDTFIQVTFQGFSILDINEPRKPYHHESQITEFGRQDKTCDWIALTVPFKDRGELEELP